MQRFRGVIPAACREGNRGKVVMRKRGVEKRVVSTENARRNARRQEVQVEAPRRQRGARRASAAKVDTKENDGEEKSDADSRLYEVEEILDKEDEDTTRYLVKWKGYPADEATWEIASDVNCPDLIREFEERSTRAEATEMETALNGDGEEKSDADSRLYEVEEILDKKDGDTTRYLVKWKGYPADEATWEIASDVNCPDLIRAFEGQRLEAQEGTNDRIATEAEAEDDNFDIELVLKRKVEEDGSVRYLVKYKDFPPGEDTAWEDAKYVPAPLIRKWENNYEKPVESSRDVSTNLKGKKRRAASENDWECDSSNDDWTTKKPKESKNETNTAIRKTSTPKATKKPPTKSTNPTRKANDAAAAFGVARMYLGKKVALSPSIETVLMPSRIYGKVGSTYLVGVICNYKYAAKEGRYEIRWLNSYFNGQRLHVDIATVLRGRANYDRISHSGEIPRWTHVFGATSRSETANVLQLVDDLDDLEEYEFTVAQATPATLADIEKETATVFDPDGRLKAPTDLFTHADGTTDTHIKPTSRHLFEHSASSSFFAYLPLYFWKQVLEETNGQGEDLANASRSKTSLPDTLDSPSAPTRSRKFVPFSMDEFMRFLGIMWYMSLVDKGEYANYWGDQVEEALFGAPRSPLESIMTLRRFKELRKAFSFRRSSDVQIEDLQRDAAIRIRPLLNMLKQTGTKHLDVGRNLAVDEACISSRSKYARHLIVFNSKKPTGKFHFKLYMTCCATTWVALTFRLHGESTFEDRAKGVYDGESTRSLAKEMEETSATRRIVLEVTRPFYDTNRIVNCDNYYTSVQLIQALRLKGLYCRGTVKVTSKHYPSHVVLAEPTRAVKDANKNSSKTRTVAAEKQQERAEAAADTAGMESTPSDQTEEESKSTDDDPLSVRRYDEEQSQLSNGQHRVNADVRRGDYKQAVSREHKMLAASWCDATIVTVLSNADASTISPVTRRVRQKAETVPAPTCVKEYNRHMQGVDRNDQFRARFSVADGHSFKKWHKKLAFAIVDIARVNAFLTRKLCCPPGKSDRDAHRQFMVELIQELFNGKWKEAPSDKDMLFGEQDTTNRVTGESPQAPASSPGSSSSSRATIACVDMDSVQIFKEKRRKRMCLVCRFEYRNDTVNTVHCLEHKVSLCKRNYASTVPYGCQQAEWTCWEKFHMWYLPRNVFSPVGSVNRSSQDYKDKRKWEATRAEQTVGSTQDGGAHRSLLFGAAPAIASDSPHTTATPAASVAFSTPSGINTPTPSIEYL